MKCKNKPLFLALSLLPWLFGCAQSPTASAPQTSEQAAPVSSVVTPEKPASAQEKRTESEIMAQIDATNSVFFPAASVQVDAPAQQRLALHAERLKADPAAIVTLYGYTDHLGSPSYNLAIAEQRVNAVAAVLRRHGVAARQIRRNAVGSEHVPVACRSPQCRRLMRRVELVFGD
ncbi:OmpA family protein [Azonexus sp.]|uniref:OmpA family protein n=1 Tax=Azonexus sp. TaxID=1872668 RepID=UPI0039E553B4